MLDEREAAAAAAPATALRGALSVVIPAHNEAENLPALLAAAQRALPALAGDWQIVLVDDGSSDGTADVARAALGEDAGHLEVVRHETKSGYGRTVLDGYAAARGDWLALIDGDGQFDVADLRLLVDEALRHGGERILVAGWRRRRADPWHRSVVSGVLNICVRVLYGVRARDVDCALKLMPRSVYADAAPFLARSALINTELYFKCQRLGVTVIQLPVPHYERLHGKRSGGRLIPILRALRDLVRLRWRLAREWRPARGPGS